MSAADKIALDQGIADALTKAEADTYYQPIGDYAPASAVASRTQTVNLVTTNIGGGYTAIISEE